MSFAGEIRAGREAARQARMALRVQTPAPPLPAADEPPPLRGCRTHGRRYDGCPLDRIDDERESLLLRLWRLL
jgi:hypothetical protein